MVYRGMTSHTLHYSLSHPHHADLHPFRIISSSLSLGTCVHVSPNGCVTVHHDSTLNSKTCQHYSRRFIGVPRKASIGRMLEDTKPLIPNKRTLLVECSQQTSIPPNQSRVFSTSTAAWHDIRRNYSPTILRRL